jgi:hypothetical protein
MGCTRKPIIGILILLSGVAAPTQGVDARSAPRSVTVHIFPAGHSGTRGTLTLTAAGKRTIAVILLRHLRPHAHPYAVMHAGTCSDLKHISASSLFLPKLTEDAKGTARGTGRVHGPDAGGWNQDVDLQSLLRGGDVVVVYANDMLVACGNVP